MDLDFSASDELFRDEVRTWLEEHVPRDARPDEGDDMVAWDREWQRKQHDAGYAGIAWPKEYGGQGLSLGRQLIWYEEYALAGGPYAGANFVGLNHGGPTLIQRGNAAQKDRHLARILDGTDVWCQGFSEPGAGSDLASLRTRGTVDGDEIVVTGQKLWTSYGQVARWQELLIRTDPTATRHKGITWVINDMQLDGIEIRPITMLTGVRHYCEIFYDEVRIPLTNVVGQLNEGWSVAMSTLGFERGTAFMQAQTELSRLVEQLIAMTRDKRGPGGLRIRDDGYYMHQLGRLRADVAAMLAMTYLAVSQSVRTGVPGPTGSLTKLYFSDLSQRVHRLAMEMFGLEGLEPDGRYVHDSWVMLYLLSYASTIGGGTSEIQRNIVAERVLGLPR